MVWYFYLSFKTGGFIAQWLLIIFLCGDKRHVLIVDSGIFLNYLVKCYTSVVKTSYLHLSKRSFRSKIKALPPVFLKSFPDTYLHIQAYTQYLIVALDFL